MVPRKKAAGLQTRAALEDDCKRKPSSFRARIKAVVIGAACWDVLPAGLAEWMIRQGGLRDA